MDSHGTSMVGILAFGGSLYKRSYGADDVQWNFSVPSEAASSYSSLKRVHPAGSKPWMGTTGGKLAQLFSSVNFVLNWTGSQIEDRILPFCGEYGRCRKLGMDNDDLPLFCGQTTTFYI